MAIQLDQRIDVAKAGGDSLLCWLCAPPATYLSSILRVDEPMEDAGLRLPDTSTSASRALTWVSLRCRSCEDWPEAGDASCGSSKSSNKG